MSYILDALRRADAERERGEVPGLQSQQHAMLDDDAATPGSRTLVWTIAALTLALVLALGWNFIGGEPPRPAPVVEAPRPAVIAVAPIAAPAPVVVPPAATPLPVPAPAIAVAPSPTRTASRPVEARRAVQRVLPADAAAAASGPPAAADTRIYAQSELPDTIRRELPKVTIGGASYSGDKASRMVIINGQVFHEGDAIANGLVLQQIKLKAAVLAYKGWRYQIDF